MLSLSKCNIITWKYKDTFIESTILRISILERYKELGSNNQDNKPHTGTNPGSIESRITAARWLYTWLLSAVIVASGVVAEDSRW